MSLESLIAVYGYPILLLGTIFEGETVLIAASFLARRGYLQLHWVLLVALTGAIAVDQFFFHLGRSRGASFLGRHPSWQRHAERTKVRLQNHQTPLILGFRFLYGLRAITPFMIGMSGIGVGRFVVLNIIGAVMWVGVFGAAGYAFGQALESMMSDVKRVEHWILAAVILAGLVVWLARRKYFLRRSEKDR